MFITLQPGLQRPTVTIADHIAIVDTLAEPSDALRLRMRLTSWFLVYLPHHEEGFAPGDLATNIADFEILTQFLDHAILAMLEAQKGGLPK